VSFIKGNLAPDLVEDRVASHYTKKIYLENLSQILKNKIGFDDYLKTAKIDNDYEKGYFLHLLSDYKFYNNFFDKNYIEHTIYQEFKKDLYYRYNLIHNYLINNYDINYYPFENEIRKRIIASQNDANYNGEMRLNIISNKQLDDFINAILQKNITRYLSELKLS